MCGASVFFIFMNVQLLDLQGELWRDVVGYEGKYQVSNLGRVKSFLRGIILKPRKCSGYHSVTLAYDGQYKQFRIHRLLLDAFMPNPENKPFVNHINGIRNDNRLENLEWCTHSENMIHAFATGLSKAYFGSKNPKSKLKEDEVLSIVEMINSGMSIRKVAKIFNVSFISIYDIKRGKFWSHLTGITHSKSC